eukprot:6213542-Pleurochrysis_carterae.AAC.7
MRGEDGNKLLHFTDQTICRQNVLLVSQINEHLSINAKQARTSGIDRDKGSPHMQPCAQAPQHVSQASATRE